MMNNCLLSSGSRNQGLIALSSAEAETYAATSGACDALFLSRCLEYLLEVIIGIKLLIDNSACRYILSRAGCGRARHLSTRIFVDAGASGTKGFDGRTSGFFRKCG